MSLYRFLSYIILLAVICLILTAGCQSKKNQAAEPVPVAQKEPMPEAAKEPPKTSVKANLQTAELVWEDDNGRPVWKAQFKEGHLAQADDSAEVQLIGVKATMFRNGKPASSLSASSVTADSNTREIVANGAVKVVSFKDNGSLAANKLVWKSKEDKIIGTGNVKIVRGNISATASKVIADTSLSKVTLSNAEIITD